MRANFPSHAWDAGRFVSAHARVHFTPQRFMERIIRTVFPQAVIQANIRSESGIVAEGGKFFLEIDVYLPEFKLGFEYQVDHILHLLLKFAYY